MSKVQAILFDIGGVLLSNGWDGPDRINVLKQFRVDVAEFEARHEQVFPDFETGRLSLDQYLNRTLFDRAQPFTKETFFAAMKAQSRLLDDTALSVLRELSEDGRYLLGYLNNESRELNEYRLDHFGLKPPATVFLSSCYVGVRKPDLAIYRFAADVLQLPPAEIIFIDDREINVEAARKAGLDAILYKGSEALREELIGRGVEFAG